ncbi:DMT family transporter [Pendulispora albinea]|uniref:DMT family transporter n=1 Tax=Pendulispora albinea TaxID=2741071 RepID=A0ABZ2LR50_9BACT
MDRAMARGVAAACGAQCILGASAAVSALLVKYPVFGAQAIRYTVAALILVGIARARGLRFVPLDRRDTLRLLLLAMTGLVGFNVCIQLSLRYTAPTTLGTLIACTPVVLALVTPLLERERPSLQLLGAGALVSSGAAITQGFGGGHPLGFLFASGALAGEVLFSLLAVPLLPKLGPFRLSAYLCVVAIPMFLALGLIVDGSNVVRVPTRIELASLIYLTVVLSALAFLLWYSGLSRLGAERAGLFTGIVPIVAAATSALLGTGRPGVVELVGAVLVGAGVVAGLRAKPRASREAPAHVCCEGLPQAE